MAQGTREKLRQQILEKIKELKDKEKIILYVCPNPLCHLVFEIPKPRKQNPCAECGTNLTRMVFKKIDLRSKPS